MKRNYSNEINDLDEKKYSYKFDDYIRQYLLVSYRPFLRGNFCLEIGSATGNFTEKLMPYFSIIDGVDPLINSTIEEYKTERKYDAIVMHNVLEHVDNVNVTLSKIRSLLKENGLFFVSVPNGNAVSRQIAVKMGLIEYTSCVTSDEYSHGHRRTYNMESFINDLSEFGFNPFYSGGVIFKAISNWQMDEALEKGIISDDYIRGCYEIGKQYPNMCGTIFAVCQK